MCDPPTARAESICIVLHDLSGGGTEHVAIRLANAWAERGRRVTLFCGSATGPLSPHLSLRVTVVQPSPECPRGFRSRDRLGRALATHLASDPHDVVFAPGNFHLPVLARFAALDRGTTTTVCKISNPLIRSTSWSPSIVRALALRQLTRRIDCFVAMSPALRVDVQEALGPRSIALAWDPILPVGPLPRPETISSPRPLVLAVGRLEPQKNFALALRAFARIAVEFDAEFMIVGEGQERAALERLAKDLGIAGRVSMPGYRTSVPHDLRRAALFVLSSRFEGYPGVLVEAVAAGIPVVTTACSPAIPEILAGHSASEIVPQHVDELAAAMARLLGQPMRHAIDADGLLMARHAIGHAAEAYLEIIDAAHARRLATRSA